MRYHLWIALASRQGPHGVLNSYAVTGAPGHTLLRRSGWGGCSKVYSPDLLSPIAPTWGLSVQGTVRLLLLFLTVLKHYHTFSPLSIPFRRKFFRRKTRTAAKSRGGAER